MLIGSNRLFLVTEMTVPGLKHARHLVNVIRERLPDGPPLEVIVNRFEQRLFGPGLRRADIEQALGNSLACTIPNNFRLVSEAIDRGVPLDEVKAGNNIQQALAQGDLPAEAEERRKAGCSQARAQARAGALRSDMFGRFTATQAALPRREAAAAAATAPPQAGPSGRRGAEPANGRGAAEARDPTPSPRRRSRRCATSCSTRKCGCTAA